MDYDYQVLVICPKIYRAGVAALAQQWDAANGANMFGDALWEKDGQEFAVCCTHGTQWLYDNYPAVRSGEVTALAALGVGFTAHLPLIASALADVQVIFYDREGQSLYPAENLPSPAEYLLEQGYTRNTND